MSERRTGAILFTDLVGFTAYTDACGDVAAVELLDRQQAVVAKALDRCPGSRIVKELGDGLMLWFDDVRDALSVAADVLRSIAVARDTAGFPLNVRMGLHVGDVVERGTDFVGHTVNIASRVCDLAGPGELVVSEQVVRSLTGTAGVGVFRPIGPVRVKGVSEPIWLHRLVD